MAELICQECRTILFCRYRKLVEVVFLHVITLLNSRGKQDIALRVKPYRAGYPSKDREKIIDDLSSGRLLGTVCTNALELGVDIGHLDATLVLGFPGSISSIYQQFGRSGRKNRDSLSIMVALNSPIEQYFVKHIQEILKRPPEAASLNIANPYYMEAHLKCAMKELDSHDLDFDCELFSSHIDAMKPSIYSIISGHHNLQSIEATDNTNNKNSFIKSNIVALSTEGKSKSRKVALYKDMSRNKVQLERYINIRGISDHKFKIVEIPKPTISTDDFPSFELSPETRILNWTVNSFNLSSELEMYKSLYMNSNKSPNYGWNWSNDIPEMKVIDEIDYNLVYFVAHPGATYLNRGKEYLIENLDLEKRIAYAIPSQVNYYTKTRDHTDVDPLYTISNYDLSSNLITSISMGQVQVNQFVYGYRKLHKFNSRPFDGIIDLNLPPFRYQTTGLWLNISDALISFLMAANIEIFQSLHAVTHAISHTIEKLLFCEPVDIAGECPHPFDRRSRPKRIMIYDSNLGGSGLIESAFKSMPDVINIALKLVENCNCKAGCDNCILHTFCGEFNNVLSKEGAIWVLQACSEAISHL